LFVDGAPDREIFLSGLKRAPFALESADGPRLRGGHGLERYQLRAVESCLLCGLGLAGLADLLFNGSPVARCYRRAVYARGEDDEGEGEEKRLHGGVWRVCGGGVWKSRVREGEVCGGVDLFSPRESLWDHSTHSTAAPYWLLTLYSLVKVASGDNSCMKEGCEKVNTGVLVLVATTIATNATICAAISEVRHIVDEYFPLRALTVPFTYPIFHSDLSSALLYRQYLTGQ
jgi:hypothetical protein